jgi:hypothetical protein
MAHSKRVELVDRLIYRTERGEVNWQETANPEAFQVAFPNYSVVVSAEQSTQSDEMDIVIILMNSAGNTIEAFSDVDLHQETGDPFYPKMKMMYDSARRKATRADEAIDEILKELDEDIPF